MYKEWEAKKGGKVIFSGIAIIMSLILIGFIYHRIHYFST